MNRDDKREIYILHSQASGSSRPALKFGDASIESSSTVWGNAAPVPIAIPTGSSQPMKSKASSILGGPWKGRVNNTLRSGSQNKPNHSRSQTSTKPVKTPGRPARTPLQAWGGKGGEGATSKRSDQGGSPKSNLLIHQTRNQPSAAAAQQPIELSSSGDDDDGEADRAKVLSKHSLPQTTSVTPAKSEDEIDFIPHEPTRTKRPLPNDGPSTTAAREQLRKKRKISPIAGEIDEDRISDADDPMALRSRPAHRSYDPSAKNVRDKISLYEGLAGPSDPTPHTRIKNRMKPRQTKQLQLIGLKGSSRPSTTTATTKALDHVSSEASSSDGSIFELPLDACAIGLELQRKENFRESLNLLVNPKTSEFQVICKPRHRLGSGPLLRFVVLTESVQNVMISEATDPDFVLQFSPTGSFGTAGVLATRLENNTSDVSGLLTLKFDTENAVWAASQHKVRDLLRILKRTKKLESLRAPASSRVWQRVLESIRYLDNSPERPILLPAEEAPNDFVQSRPPSPQHRPGPRPRPISKGKTGQSESRRRPTRQSSARENRLESTPDPPAPVPNADEVILVYPATGTGAINITNGDVARLNPSEFLNDTLIEFGLKLWLAELKDSKPELANQIHIFSSYFYKKLSTKIPEEGFNSVRKWTSKFDLFEKKYIIVPINERYHWYLAIISNPAYVLNTPPPKEQKSMPQTRSQQRRSSAGDQPQASASAPLLRSRAQSASPRTPESHASSLPPVAHLIPASSPPTRRHSPAASTYSSSVAADSMSMDDERTDENQVEDIVMGDPLSSPIRQRKHSTEVDEEMEILSQGYSDKVKIEDDNYPSVTRDPSPDPVEDTNLSYPDPEEVDIDNKVFEAHLSHERDAPASAILESSRLKFTGKTKDDGDSEVEVVAESRRDEKGKGKQLIVEDSEAIPPESFYGQPSKAPRTYRRSRPVESPLEIHDDNDSDRRDSVLNITDEDESHSEHPAHPTTMIYTFDSLTSKHPQAIKRLSKYLQLEAIAKGKVPDEAHTTPPVGKKVHVPHQPNFSDCGVYLLYFAQQFMNDPDHSEKVIAEQAPSRPPNEHWGGTSVGKFRQELLARIHSLSEPWLEEKKKRLANGEKVDGDDADSDVMEVEVVEQDPPPPPPSKVGKGKEKKVEVEIAESDGAVTTGKAGRRTSGRQAPISSSAGPSRGIAERLR